MTSIEIVAAVKSITLLNYFPQASLKVGLENGHA